MLFEVEQIDQVEKTLGQTLRGHLMQVAGITILLSMISATAQASLPSSNSQSAPALVASETAGEVSDVVGFQEWKSSRIDEARSHLERLTTLDKSNLQAKAHDSKAKSAGRNSRSQSKGSRPDHRIQQAQINLEIAQELSVNDFLHLYVNQLKDRDSFIEIVKKLTPEEAADLLMAYQKSTVQAGHLAQDTKILQKPSPFAGKSQP